MFTLFRLPSAYSIPRKPIQTLLIQCGIASVVFSDHHPINKYLENYPQGSGWWESQGLHFLPKILRDLGKLLLTIQDKLHFIKITQIALLRKLYLTA